MVDDAACDRNFLLIHCEVVFNDGLGLQLLDILGEICYDLSEHLNISVIFGIIIAAISFISPWMICLVTLVVLVMRGRRMLRSCIFWLSGLLLLFLGAPWIVTWLPLGLIDGGVRQFWFRSWVRESLIAWLNS